MATPLNIFSANSTLQVAMFVRGPDRPSVAGERLGKNRMHIAIITAGGAGMFCGSCMHDNTWARALQDAGAEISLIPTYTPIRVDEPNLSTRHVFLGGVNVYLDYRWRFWNKLPRGLTRWLDAPWVINLATRFGVSNDTRELGELTLAMLAGEAGPQRTEVAELATFLGELRPDVVVFSNALLCGALREVKRHFDGPVFCTLQGDDVFLEGLADEYRGEAVARISERAQQFDGFLTHSRYYREFMAGYLNLPAEKFHQLPLGIDLSDHDGLAQDESDGPPTIGYFARICPEKGLHNLIDAFRILRKRCPDVRLQAGGYLGKQDEAYFARLRRDASDLGEAFEYIGSPSDHHAKVEFLKSIEVLSVPTDYREPKGIYVLEALANAVPVVQPDHGAFPELIAATEGGLLYPAGDNAALAAALEELLQQPRRRLELARAGQLRVRERFNPQVMAERSLEIFRGQTSAVADE